MNNFKGRVPIGVSSWTNVVEFKASKNYLNGSIPQELTNLPKLETLLLDQNQFKGSLPNDMISWKSLVTLNLSQNQLNGHIPISIGHLPSLGVLDLSENQFTGEIPSILPRITNLNLSSNFLTGRVPSEFENSAFDRSFLNNSGLCADTPTLSVTLCNFGLKKSTKTSHWKQALENSWKLISFQRLSFTESNIVSSLAEQNIIGSGGFGTVYRVPVDGLGYVAVKKITSNRKLRKKLETSFRAEVEILRNIRHRNIVKLLCCISNEDSMMLVFGVILLELTTGKEATYGDEHSSLVEWSWRHVHVGSNIEDLLDKDFVEQSYLDEMCCIFKLGIMCTTTFPSSRPSMKEVLNILLRSEGGIVFGERNVIVREYDDAPFLKNSKRDSRLDFVDSDSD
ncbi:hypothetical protein TSUD_142310 [Trifolium subterraneum]|uniref:Protein kinase domain-containing protein n=1 Tax=Trifolium subterraneum TaxID=3900 RepID=A0A2Z6LTW6_TRISU|nr:hypothetical protein TSUD_142310 [Trifolium subterraneum]